jgi:hypothetical protein
MAKRQIKKTDIIIIIVLIIFVFATMNWLSRVKKNAYLMVYRNHIKDLQRSFQQYASDFNGHYPPANKWCDALIQKERIRSEYFVSSWAGDPMFHETTDPCDKPNFPVPLRQLRDYNDSNGIHHYVYIVQWCHFAFNPDAEPNSSGDVVLLFSTKGGWNQFGGPEIFSTENYKELNRIGGYVLFNNGDVRFVTPKEVPNLKWNKRI